MPSLVGSEMCIRDRRVGPTRSRRIRHGGDSHPEMPSSPGNAGLARAHPLTKTQAMEPSRQTWSSHGPPYPLGRWSCARTNEHVAASKPRGGDTARRNSENIRISRARPDRRPVRLETRWRGRADVAWDWNLTDLVGLGPMILKISPAGPVAGLARRRRLGPARPHLRELAPPAKSGRK